METNESSIKKSQTDKVRRPLQVTQEGIDEINAAFDDVIEAIRNWANIPADDPTK